MSHPTLTRKLTITAALLGLAVITMGANGCGSSIEEQAHRRRPPSATHPTTCPATTVPPTTPAPAAPSLTPSQQNAVQAATNYLSFQAFSRLGLIKQLSSQYGDKYSVADATVAVDSLHEDWNAQAAKSAKDYLKTQPFSCSGLIQQLSSSYGSQYTAAQAQYGAKAAGIC